MTELKEVLWCYRTEVLKNGVEFRVVLANNYLMDNIEVNVRTRTKLFECGKKYEVIVREME